ncbi:MAG: hypothetical protein Q4D30_01430 [Bacteroidales bacterium]|nr:hypothetical protein [Bacteroidales bacterium]
MEQGGGDGAVRNVHALFLPQAQGRQGMPGVLPASQVGVHHRPWRDAQAVQGLREVQAAGRVLPRHTQERAERHLGAVQGVRHRQAERQEARAPIARNE